VDFKLLTSTGVRLLTLMVLSVLSSCEAEEAGESGDAFASEATRTVTVLEDVGLGSCGAIMDGNRLIDGTWYDAVLIGVGRAGQNCDIPSTVGRELRSLPVDELERIAVLWIHGAVDFDTQQFPFSRMKNLQEVSFSRGPFTGTPQGLAEARPLSLVVSGFDDIRWIGAVHSLVSLRVSATEPLQFPKGLSGWNDFGLLVSFSSFDDLTGLRSVPNGFRVSVQGDPFEALRDLVGSRAEIVVLSEEKQAQIPDVVDELRQSGIEVVSDWEL
jgi:hypothetical protein